MELVAGNRQALRDVLALITGPFEQARDVAQRRLGADDIEVHVVDAPDECIPEWGLGGYAYGPHAIVLAVDPEHDIDPVNVFSTLVHELHHVMRWRGPGCGTSLGERLISEGLALVFEEECSGAVPLYAQGQLSDEERSRAVAALDEDPANESRWFFGGAEFPRWFGYRFGWEVVSAQTARRGVNAADLVLEPAAAFWTPS